MLKNNTINFIKNLQFLIFFPTGYSVESGIFEVNGTVLHIAGAPRSKKGYGQVNYI